MDIVVKGRHLEVSERFRTHVAEKLAKVERLDAKVQRVDVEVCKEPNPRLADRAFRVELTCMGRGPVIRAEAAADDKYAAMDAAMSKLESRLRRSAERRTDWKKKANGNGVSSVAAVSRGAAAEPHPVSRPDGGAEDGADTGPMVVREKVHAATPMTLDQALYEMELVGHDFYLFQDVASGRPSVVYRRRGYDYGVIHLELEPVT